MKPLVTVAVTTYRSAVYVIETLESVYGQTYQEIALVISDDCSPDNTVALVNDWIALERVQNRFVSIEVITVPKNTGVSANCNRCIKAAAGDWIKFIAGDDILYPNCITDNMQFAAENPEAHIIFSQIKLYQDDFTEAKYIKTTPEYFPSNLMKSSLSAHDQYQLLLVSDRIHYTPSYFFNKQALLRVGGYDETNRLVEDYPMWLKLTKSGERLYYFHKITVGYRIHANATNNVSSNVLFKPSVFNTFLIRKQFAHPSLPWEMVGSEYQTYWVSKLFSQLGWNKKTAFFTSLYRVGCFYMNPFQYVYALKKRWPSNKQNPFYF